MSVTARGGVAGRFAKAILAHAARSGLAARLVEVDQRDWASATFTGLRQRILLMVASATELEGWLAALPEAEFDIPGHLVADLAVDAPPLPGADRRVTLTALLLRQA